LVIRPDTIYVGEKKTNKTSNFKFKVHNILIKNFGSTLTLQKESAGWRKRIYVVVWDDSAVYN